MDNTKLTEQEELFCELYVHGTAPYAGNEVKCYSEVFKDNGLRARHRAMELMGRDYIGKYIEQLEAEDKASTSGMKRYLTQNLMKILEETSTAQFRDRRGTLLSTAPLRSVAVSAAKALMDLYPVKQSQTTNLNIEGNSGKGGITFNVILPDAKKSEEGTDVVLDND